jgi:pimeloyl-ACP methyl ester carboxylesterase
VLTGGVRSLNAVAVDLAGFGAAPPPATAWGSVDYATSVAPILDEMAAPIVVVGHSLGGRVALQLALARPERLHGLVLTGVPLFPRRGARRPSRRFRLLRRLKAFELVSNERMEAARRRYGSQDYAAASGIMRETLVRLVNEDYAHDLARLTVPTALVWGSDDDAVPLEVAERAAGAITDATLVVVAGADHFVPLVAPDALRNAIEVALA